MTYVLSSKLIAHSRRQCLIHLRSFLNLKQLEERYKHVHEQPNNTTSLRSMTSTLPRPNKDAIMATTVSAVYDNSPPRNVVVRLPGQANHKVIPWSKHTSATATAAVAAASRPTWMPMEYPRVRLGQPVSLPPLSNLVPCLHRGSLLIVLPFCFNP